MTSHLLSTGSCTWARGSIRLHLLQLEVHSLLREATLPKLWRTPVASIAHPYQMSNCLQKYCLAVWGTHLHPSWQLRAYGNSGTRKRTGAKSHLFGKVWQRTGPTARQRLTMKSSRQTDTRVPKWGQRPRTRGTRLRSKTSLQVMGLPSTSTERRRSSLRRRQDNPRTLIFGAAQAHQLFVSQNNNLKKKSSHQLFSVPTPHISLLTKV